MEAQLISEQKDVFRFVTEMHNLEGSLYRLDPGLSLLTFTLPPPPSGHVESQIGHGTSLGLGVLICYMGIRML